MPLSDEDRPEIKAIVKNALDESKRIPTSWRTPFLLLLGAAVMPLAAVSLLRMHYPTNPLEWADLGRFSMGIGYLAMVAIRLVMGIADLGNAHRRFLQRAHAVGLNTGARGVGPPRRSGDRG
jgi:hypothetical protein